MKEEEKQPGVHLMYADYFWVLGPYTSIPEMVYTSREYIATFLPLSQPGNKADSHLLHVEGRNYVLQKFIKVNTCVSCASHRAQGKFGQTKWRSSKRSRDDAMLSSTSPIHGSATKVNCSGADVQVVSFHLAFHPFVEQLTVFWIHSGVIF